MRETWLPNVLFVVRYISLQEIREDVSGYVNNRIDDMMSEIQRKIRMPLTKNGEFLYIDKYRDKR